MNTLKEVVHTLFCFYCFNCLYILSLYILLTSLCKAYTHICTSLRIVYIEYEYFLWPSIVALSSSFCIIGQMSCYITVFISSSSELLFRVCWQATDTILAVVCSIDCQKQYSQYGNGFIMMFVYATTWAVP